MQGGTRVESAKELQTLVLKQKSFSKYYEILYLETVHDRTNKIYYSNFSMYKYSLTLRMENLIGSIYTQPYLWAFKGKNVELSLCHNPYVWFKRSGYTSTMFLFYARTSDITRVNIYLHIWYMSRAYCL